MTRNRLRATSISSEVWGDPEESRTGAAEMMESPRDKTSEDERALVLTRGAALGEAGVDVDDSDTSKIGETGRELLGLKSSFASSRDSVPSYAGRSVFGESGGVRGVRADTGARSAPVKGETPLKRRAGGVSPVPLRLGPLFEIEVPPEEDVS